MSDDAGIEEIGRDLDRMMRSTVMMLGQVLERRARRRAETDREAAGAARKGWLDERDTARKTFVPMTFGHRAEQASPQELAAAWRAAHEWASTDPVAAAAAEHLHRQWEWLHPDKDPALVGVTLAPETARRLAQEHAPEFYRRHVPADGEQADPLREQQLVADWTHWAEHGQLPHESLLREHAAWLGHDVTTAGEEAVEAWKQQNFPPEARGSDGTAVVVVPSDRSQEMDQIRSVAEVEAAQRIWANAGREPSPTDPGQTLTVEQAQALARQHAPAYYGPERISDERLVADWTHWLNNDGQLPQQAVWRQWAAQLDREDEIYEAADDAEATLRNRVPNPDPDQVELVRIGAENEKLEELWATSSQIDVDRAEQLAEKHAPPWYTAPDSATLRDDWQSYVTHGEIPLTRQQEAWAAWAGHETEVAPQAWTDQTGVIDDEGRGERLQQIWDDGRDERVSLEYAAAVAGAEAAAADRAELDGRDAAAWSRVAQALQEQGPDATDLIGDLEHARGVYAPLLDPGAFASADSAAAGRAWLAASVWASEDHSAQAAADQLGQQFRTRFGVDPSTGEAVETIAVATPTEASAAVPEVQERISRSGADREDHGQAGPRSRIVELHAQAAQFYAAAYPGSKAEEHMTERFGPDAAARSGLTVGYAPAGWRNLTDTLRGQGATEDELVESGLARRNSIGKLQDTFRDRVVFAVRDAEDGAIVGFTGRDLSGDDRAPKYWNTNTTAAFDKSRLLLGIAETAPGAELVRVEGAMDVVAINLASPDQSKIAGVAPMGTALTEHQADMLAARASHGRVLESLDPDAAGMKARARDTRLLADRGVSLRMLGAGGMGDPAETYAFAPEFLQMGLQDAVAQENGPTRSMNVAMHERVFGQDSAALAGEENAWPAAQALAPMIAATPRQDQAATVRRAEELMVAKAEGRLSAHDARAWLTDALQHEVGRGGWAAGTSWDTFAADLSTDLDAAQWETAQDTQRARAAETEQASDAEQREHQARTASVTAAPRPEIYDRASESTPDQDEVTPAMIQARQRASAGFTRSTADGVAAAQTKRARLPRRPVKAARTSQQHGKRHDRGI